MKKFLVFLIILSIGFFLGKITPNKDPETEKEKPLGGQQEAKEIRQGGYQFINPLLECEPASNENLEKLAPLTQEVKKIINEKIETLQASHISFYYRDLNNGPWFGINEDENFSPASLLKVPLMMAYFKKASLDSSFLNNKIFYDEAERTLEINVPEEERLKNGQEYSIIELITRMISFSDNSSFELLSKSISAEEIEKIHRDLGITVPSEKVPENFISVQEYASLFRVLYNSSYLSRELSEKALEILSTTSFKDGIVAGMPEKTVVAHKFGIRDYQNTEKKQLHDCGIVYASNNPYLICVMTRGADLENLSKTIKDVSQAVYKNIQN